MIKSDGLLVSTQSLTHCLPWSVFSLWIESVVDGHYTGDRLVKVLHSSLLVVFQKSLPTLRIPMLKPKLVVRLLPWSFCSLPSLVPPGLLSHGYTQLRSSLLKFVPKEMPGVLSVGLLVMGYVFSPLFPFYKECEN